MTYTVSAFYKFVDLPLFEAMRAPLLKVMDAYQIKGTLILAKEGINGSFCGSEDAVSSMKQYLQSYASLTDLLFCDTHCDRNPFEKAKVKLRKEIVTMGDANISPLDVKGIYLSPEEWNEKLKQKDILVIDTRNTYEVSLGTFKGAINPETENFRDFPDYVFKQLQDHKHKPIAMFCTGGIRCEKSTSLLKKMGFDEVYHLQGGILHYLASIPEEESLWKGSCFVFDERVALDSSLQSLPEGSIDPEWKNKNKKAARLTETE